MPEGIERLEEIVAEFVDAIEVYKRADPRFAIHKMEIDLSVEYKGHKFKVKRIMIE